ncbi:MAG: hypothetical protein IJP13_03680 [Lachnospiraceae bacterium]|nr:hypothetical protein [Lachnospiraceae bacterium]
MSVKKKLIIFAVTVFGIFIVIAAVWFFGIGIKYVDWLDSVERQEDGELVYYESVHGDYLLKVKPAMFMAFEGGFLRISKNEDFIIYLDEEGNAVYENELKIDYYIWPKFGTDYEMGVMIFSGDNTYQVIFDKDLNIINYSTEDDDYAIVCDYIKENSSEIKKMMACAEEMWGFDFEEE